MMWTVMTVISEEKTEELFQESRDFFSFPPCVIDFDSNAPAPFCIQNGRVFVNLEATEGMSEGDLKNILLHELGHFCVYPKYYRTTVQCFEALEKGVKEELEGMNFGPHKLGSIAHELLLMLADVVVNRQLHDWGIDIAETHKRMVEDSEKKAIFEQHPLRQLFGAMENYSQEVDYFPVTHQKAAEYGEQIVDELMRLLPQEARFEEAGRIAARFLKEIDGEEYEQPDDQEGEGGEGEGEESEDGEGQGDQEGEEQEGEGQGEGQDSDQNQDSHENGKGKADKSKGDKSEGEGKPSKTRTETVDIEEDVEDVLEELSEILRESPELPTQDMDGEEEAQDEALQDLTLEQLEKVRGAKPGHGSGSVKGLNDARYYRARARKNVKFKARVMANKGGHIGDGGLIGWGMDDPLERLDVMETVSSNGLVLPTINTLQYEPKEGGGEPVRTHPAVQIILDTSGSMPQETAILTCFSLIEAARLSNVEVSLVLYHDKCWMHESFTRSYNRLQEAMIGHYESGGTRSYNGVLAAKEILEKRTEPALIIWVSDLEDYANQLTPCFDALDGFREKGHLVSLLHLDAKRWKNGWGYQNLQVIHKRKAVYLAAEVNHMDDLDGLVIDQLNSYVN